MVIAQQYPHLHQDIVNALSSGASNGSKEYMKFYQKGSSKLIKKLPGKDIEAAMELAKKWNSLGPPREIQIW